MKLTFQFNNTFVSLVFRIFCSFSLSFSAKRDVHIKTKQFNTCSKTINECIVSVHWYCLQTKHQNYRHTMCYKNFYYRKLKYVARHFWMSFIIVRVFLCVCIAILTVHIFQCSLFVHLTIKIIKFVSSVLDGAIFTANISFYKFKRKPYYIYFICRRDA